MIILVLMGKIKKVQVIPVDLLDQSKNFAVSSYVIVVSGRKGSDGEGTKGQCSLIGS